MKKIAIIGASYLQLPLVEKAREMGLETHCFAWDDGAICKDYVDFFYPISIIEKEKIFEVCKSIEINGITTIASDVGVSTISFIAEKLGLICNSYSDSLVSTNKYLMRKRFSESMVPCPRYIIANCNNSIIDNLKYPLIVKPTDRSGSRGVRKVENKDSLSDAITRAQNESFCNQAIVEEYITGVEVSVESISWKGEHYILAITDKVTTGNPYFVELEHHQPSVLNENIQEKIKTETIKALNSLNIKYGASHSEFKITENGEVFVIEVGARMGGDFIGSDLVELSTGYDFIKGVIEVALGQFTTPILQNKCYTGVFFLCKETEYLFSIIKNSARFPEIKKAEITNDELKSIQCSADRSGYFIYKSSKRFKA